MATRERCAQVATQLEAAEEAMKGATASLRLTVDLLRQEPILGQDPELLDTLAVVTDANRSAVTRLLERLKRVLEPS